MNPILDDSDGEDGWQIELTFSQTPKTHATSKSHTTGSPKNTLTTSSRPLTTSSRALTSRGGLNSYRSAKTIERWRVKKETTVSPHLRLECSSFEQLTNIFSEAYIEKKIEASRIALFSIYAQHLCVGFVSRAISAILYGVFQGYLEIDGYAFKAMELLIHFPLSSKFFVGLFAENLPILGFRRKPYLILGWTLCGLMLILASFTPLPDPYWCRDASGEYKTIDSATGERATPCNPDAKNAAGKYAVMFMLAALGYVLVDATVDGLVAIYGRAEKRVNITSTRATAYTVRAVGEALASVLVGLLMNGKQYTGSFGWSLSFENVCLCLAILAFIMVPFSASLEYEPDVASKGMKTCVADLWNLLKSKAFFFVFLSSFLGPCLSNIRTTADPKVKLIWAGVGNLQDQVFSVIASVTFIICMCLVKAKGLNVNWRSLSALTLIAPSFFYILCTSLTVFDVVRNPYIYLGGNAMTNITNGMHFMLLVLIAAEIAEDGNEGMVHGFLTSMVHLAGLFSKTLSIQFFGLFHDSLSDERNYRFDDSSFQKSVFESGVISYAISALSLMALFFMPKSHEEARSWMKISTWRRTYAVATTIISSFCFVYGITIGILALIPSTSCIRFAVGNGCYGDGDISSG